MKRDNSKKFTLRVIKPAGYADLRSGESHSVDTLVVDRQEALSIIAHVTGDGWVFKDHKQAALLRDLLDRGEKITRQSLYHGQSTSWEIEAC